MTTVTKDTHILDPSGNSGIDGGSKACPQPHGFISEATVGNQKVGYALTGFVLTQVEKLDKRQKENELNGARAHFLPKSSIQGKNMLNVKVCRKEFCKGKET
ncbi:hypothetical protein C5167_002890 [Papaver somniferum]|uniref:Uncharacterized protein n=1 Tax=Papaver somniferum TaxID=3469 RepID=A0A4Y7L151_PAPSO|nr:hypothetical protein C5167_002890 [Papaver somniferum]